MSSKAKKRKRLQQSNNSVIIIHLIIYVEETVGSLAICSCPHVCINGQFIKSPSQVYISPNGQ